MLKISTITGQVEHHQIRLNQNLKHTWFKATVCCDISFQIFSHKYQILKVTNNLNLQGIVYSCCYEMNNMSLLNSQLPLFSFLFNHVVKETVIIDTNITNNLTHVMQDKTWDHHLIDIFQVHIQTIQETPSSCLEQLPKCAVNTRSTLIQLTAKSSFIYTQISGIIL